MNGQGFSTRHTSAAGTLAPRTINRVKSVIGNLWYLTGHLQDFPLLQEITRIFPIT